jgi:hypothetical protein
MVCREICSHYKAIRPSTGMRYLIGQKRCQVCQIFINWQELWCPCCGYRLRTKPRNKKYQYNLLLSNNIIKK